MLDLAHRYAELASDVDGAGLPSPYDLRRYADRRARKRAAALTAAGVVVAAGSTSTGLALVGGSPPSLPVPTPTPPASTAPTTPAPSPSPPSATPVTEIPNRAFVVLPEEYRKDAQRHDAEPSEAVPGFCDGALAEDDRVTVRRSVYSIYQAPGTPADHVPLGTVFQTVTGYRDGGAAAFMDQLRAAAAGCDTYRQDRTDVTFEVLDPPAAGDEAVLLERTWPSTQPESSTTTSLIAVVRVGDVVTILFDRGWESASSERDYVDRFVEWSVSAIEAWR